MAPIRRFRRGDSVAEKLRDAEARLAETQRLAELGSWSWNVRDNTVEWSEQLYRLFGVSPQEVEASLAAFLAGVHPDELQMVSETLQAVVDGHAERFEFDYRRAMPDGQLRWHRGRGQGVYDRRGKIVRLFGTVQDITVSRKAEQLVLEQRDELAVLATVMEATVDSVIVCAVDGTVLRWNGGAERLYGYTAQEAVGQHMSFITAPEQMAVVPDLLAELSARGHARIEGHDIRKDGTHIRTSTTISAIRPDGGPITSMVGIARDVTEQRRAEELERKHAEELTWLAFHDTLTGLPNRAMLRDRLDHALAFRSERPIHLLLLDLDDFKAVNDTSGHAYGDLVLQVVAERLLTCVRPVDTVARLGGDEFAILLEDPDADPGAVAERVLRALSEPVIVNNVVRTPMGSIGIGSNEDGTYDPNEVLLRADAAMYAAKANGKGTMKWFSPDMTGAIRARAELEAALRQAVARREFVVHYQPIIDVRAVSVLRVEALVRWQRLDGLVPPNEFIPLAESAGIISEIGAEVLRQALSDLRTWLRRDPRRSVAVNVSAAELMNQRFVDGVANELKGAGVRPEQLVLEVTERTFLAPGSKPADDLRTLQRQGIRVSIDDFGAGYHSLARLAALPVDSIKIGKSFLGELQTAQENPPILTAIVAMAHSLGLDVTAEGVETALQAERLIAIGCDRLQGYHFSHPVPSGQLATAIETAYKRYPT